MQSERYQILIQALRTDGRARLTELSKQIGSPVSTIHDKIRNNPEINRFCALLNFRKIGYGCSAIIFLRTSKEHKIELGKYLIRHQNVNNLYKVNNGNDYCIETVFRDLKELEDFIEEMETEHQLKSKIVHYLLDEIKREGFMNHGNTWPSTEPALEKARIDLNTHRRKKEP